MNLDRFATNLWAFTVVLILCLGGLGLQAQEAEPAAGATEGDEVSNLDIEIEEIKVNFPKMVTQSLQNVDTSYYDVEYLRSDDKWMEVLFKYRAQDLVKGSGSKKEKKATSLIKELTFKVFVEGKDPVKVLEKKESLIALTGEVTYINVRKTENNSKYRYGVFYVHPDTVDVYGMKELFSQNKGEVRIQAFVGTAPALFGDAGGTGTPSIKDLREKGETAWSKVFDSITKVPGFVLSKDQTPWQWVNVDRFPLIKAKDAKP